MAGFVDHVRSGGVLLDSAMGTELERRGADCSLPLWSARALIDRPDLVSAIHAENVDAGADVLTANTFRTTVRSLSHGGFGERAAELTRKAVELARFAAGGADRRIWIAGALAPLEDCYRPDLVPGDDALNREHAAQSASLAAAGADLILVETMNSARELLTASQAACATGLPVVASIVTDGEGALLSGESIEEAVEALSPLRLAGLGINCVTSDRIGADLARLRRAAMSLPLAVYANILSTRDSPQVYAARAAGWRRAGASMIGGCCGTTPAHVAALREGLRS